MHANGAERCIMDAFMNPSPQGKKSVLFIASEDLVVRNILDTPVWDEILPALRKATVTLVVPKGRTAEFNERYADVDVTVKEFNRARPSHIDALVATLLYAGLPTHTNHWSKMRALLRGDASFFATYAKRIHAATLGRIHLYQRLLRKLFILVGRDNAAQALFDEVCPDLVISLSITNFDTDVVLMREAKRRNIRVVGMTRSWDNLTSHGALRVVPDRIIVQNSFLHDAARGVQGISSRDAAIEIAGLPHYDPVCRVEEYAGTRAEFCAEYDLDPKKKIILYGAMGTFLFKRENDLVEIFSELVLKNSFQQEVQFLYRPHPKFGIPESIGNIPGVTIDRSATYRSDEDRARSASEELFRTMYHADVVVTGGSTFAIDAAVLDKPVVCINFDGTAKKGEVAYWESVNRFYDAYTHFEELLAQGGVRVARTPEALVREVQRYLDHPELEREGRSRIVERFVGAADGHTGERLGALLRDEVTT